MSPSPSKPCIKAPAHQLSVLSSGLGSWGEPFWLRECGVIYNKKWCDFKDLIFFLIFHNLFFFFGSSDSPNEWEWSWNRSAQLGIGFFFRKREIENNPMQKSEVTCSYQNFKGSERFSFFLSCRRRERRIIDHITFNCVCGIRPHHMSNFIYYRKWL